MNTKFFKNIEVAKALGLKEEVLYVENQVTITIGDNDPVIVNG
ncbi:MULTISPECIES: hypothetical protein [Clostridium]|uniref:Uncharacterized protein n=1 Tax=Clostridium frigoriphilum TaxID=443253 RepID=A0ABU7US79_9CLOT|nr:hypothetical protein [Clostridium sp. DSM 17811]